MLNSRTERVSLLPFPIIDLNSSVPQKTGRFNDLSPGPGLSLQSIHVNKQQTFGCQQAVVKFNFLQSNTKASKTLHAPSHISLSIVQHYPGPSIDRVNICSPQPSMKLLELNHYGLL